ncbi:hypothetical protein D3C80_1467720 [compost metagenome]
MRWDRQLFFGHHDIDQHRTVDGKRTLQRFIHVCGFFHADARDTAGFGDFRKVGIVQLRAVGQIATGFHLHRHESQHAVIEHHDFQRQLHLYDR